jgi:hypothetical protein
MEGMRGRGIRCQQLLDDVKETWRYWKLTEEALVHSTWITSFGRNYGPVVRHNTTNE